MVCQECIQIELVATCTITELSHMKKKPRFTSKIIQFLIVVVLSLGLGLQGSHGGVILQLQHDPNSPAHRANGPYVADIYGDRHPGIRAESPDPG